MRIEKALDANYVYNASAMGGGMPFLMFGQGAAPQNQQQEPAKPSEP